MGLPKAARSAIYALLTCVVLYFFPLFRIRSLGSEATSDSSRNQAQSAAGPGGEARSGNAVPQNNAKFDVTKFVEQLWYERLPLAATNAVSVEELLALAATDVAAARKKFGRQVGLGGPTYLFVRGQGKVESVDEDECRLIVAGQSQHIVLDIGILLGNAVRDATGLTKVDAFPNSQDFNNLSSELNRRCETQVIEPVRQQLVFGAAVEFAGCGEVRDDADFSVLRLIPVQLRIVQDRGHQ